MIKKFYFPLTVNGYGKDEDGYWSDEAIEYDGKYADCYRSQIERKFDGYNDVLYDYNTDIITDVTEDFNKAVQTERAERNIKEILENN